MYHYNLLPLPAQKSIKRWMIAQQVIVGVAVVNLFMIACTLVLWNANRGFSTLINTSEAQAQQSIDLRSARIVPYDIDTVNQEIAVIRAIQDQHMNMLALTNGIALLLPSGVTTSHIAVDVVSKKITFTGTAKTRTSFQALRDSIQASNAFTVVSFPYDALTKPSDIEFQIVVNFKPERFLYE